MMVRTVPSRKFYVQECPTGDGLTVKWGWTWLNFITSVLINRTRFLLDIGIFQLHAWFVFGAEASGLGEGYPTFDLVHSYSHMIIAGIVLALLQFLPLHFGVLLLETPEVSHIFRDGRVEPLPEVPEQTLTRKVY